MQAYFLFSLSGKTKNQCFLDLATSFFQYILRLFLSIVILSSVLFSHEIIAAPEKVSIQLKWQHSFQFAGYYAAIEKGFYRDVGLEVTLKEIDFSKDYVQQVLSNESEYGVSDSTLLIYHLQNKPVILLNQFFQHSALVFLSLRDSGIVSPYEMVGKSVSFNVKNQGDASLNALLLNTLAGLDKIRIIPVNAAYQQDFIDGKIDIVSAYSTSQPYLFKEQGVDVNIISPQSYGIDYYGDNLFTSQRELDAHPQRVKNVSEATIKGWKYALDHPDEIIQLIRKQYAPSLSDGYLQFEARSTRQMIVPELIELGSVDPRRYHQAAADYQRLGFAKSREIKNDFFYLLSDQPDVSLKLSDEEKNWIKKHPQIAVGGGSDWAPFDFVDNNGKYSGFANDYLNLIADKTGLKFNVAIDQWSHHLKNIRDKKIDLLAAAYYTKERSEYVNFSTPYIEALDYFFIRDDLKVKTIKDLNGKRVAIPKDYAHGGMIKKHFPEIKIVTVNTFNDAIDAVLENRADLLFDNYAALSYVFKHEGVSTIIPFKSTRKLGNNPIHIITRKDEPLLASIVQKGLNAISIEEKQTIYKRWLGRTNRVENKQIKLTAKELAWIDKHPHVSVGGLADLTPFSFVDKDKKPKGIIRDYLSLISEKTGLNFAIQIDDWNVLLKRLREKQLDVIGGAFYTDKRSQFAFYSSPYFEVLNYFYIRNDVVANKLTDLNGKRVAIPKGFAHAALIKKYFPEIKIVSVDGFGDAIDAVLEKRAELLFNAYATLKYTLKKEGIDTIVPFKSTRQIMGTSRFHIISRKNAPELAAIIQKGFDAITEKEKTAIYNKWLGQKTVQKVQKLELSLDEQQWLKQHKVIRFTGDPNWLPYEAFDKQGDYIGIVADHLKIIQQKLGIHIDIIPTKTWAETLNKVKRGEIDVLSETNDSDLKSLLTFTQAYISSPVVIVMEKNEDYVENIDQIKQRKIAVIEAYGYTPKIIRQYPEIDFVKVKSIQEGLTAVSMGKVDALLATLTQASYHISELGIHNIRIVGKTEFTTQLAFGMSKQFSRLIPLFNKALSSISRSEKQAIFDKWGKHKYAEKIDYTFLAIVVGISFFIIAGIVFWNRKLAEEVRRRKDLEEQTQALMDNIPLQIVVTSRNGGILTANPKVLSDYEIHKNEINQFNMADFYYDSNDRNDVLKELAEHGKVEQKIILFKGVYGIRSMMVSVMPVNYQNENAFLTIAVDMTDRLEMESELQKAKDKAEIANRAKSDFLANMSHEIRTPMNAIIGFSELLNDQVQDPKLKSFVKTIQSASNNLLSLINDILDLSKIEAGKFQIKKVPSNPHELFMELGDIFMIKMREKNIDFLLEIDPAIPQSLLLDVTRLRQVMLNLIGNAVKFTDQGYIRVKAGIDSKDDISSKLNLFIEVEDSGIGISADQQQLIFQDFEQSSGQNVKKYGGTGLGLSISKRLVEMMGGKLLLQSDLDQGSIFTVKLTDISISSLTIEAENVQMDNNTELRFLPAELLIVDDVADNRQVLQASLLDTELKIVAAKNGLEAVELAKKQIFDLILMDIRMPIMDGYQAAKEIKSFSEVPIVALTASVMVDAFETIKRNDFDGYLRKPVLKSNLIAELCQFLPFEKIKKQQQPLKAVVLTDEEEKWLGFVLEGLEGFSPHCEQVLKSNNITEIRAFSDEVLKIGKQYSFSAIIDYATQLNTFIDCFDIAEIKKSLEGYQILISQLESYNSKEGFSENSDLKDLNDY